MGQSAVLDEGRLDPAWFGPGVVFQPSKALGFQWLKPGLDLRKRTLQVRAWEPAAWPMGKRDTKDQVFYGRIERQLQPNLASGLKKGLKGTVPLSPTGDVLVIGRMVDAVGEAGDYLSVGGVTFSFDVKVVDGDTGELLGAFHDTLRGPNADTLPLQLGRWSESLGQALGAAVPSPPVVVATPAPAQPAFDLEGALRRIEGLKRDGLISEEEYQSLKKKAQENAAGKAH
jgi:hypothetical protein